MLLSKIKDTPLARYWWTSPIKKNLMNMTIVLEKSFICVSCLYKEIPFVPFLVGVCSNHFGICSHLSIRSHLGMRSHFGIHSNHFRLYRYRLILRPIFIIDRLISFIYYSILLSLLGYEHSLLLSRDYSAV